VVAEFNDEETEMFKYIGGAVVYGFAFFGLGKFLERERVKVVCVPASRKDRGETTTDKSPNVSETSAVSQVDGRSVDGGEAEQSQEGSLATEPDASSEHR